MNQILSSRLTAVSLLCALPAVASDTIETISVTGARLPIHNEQLASSLTVIDHDTIQRSQALTVLDLLRSQAGMNISQSGGRGSVAEIRLRGTESNHTLVLVDGVAINDLGSGGLVDFSQLSLDHIARIEILRGPQSALWGSGAVGGVINIITHQPDRQRVSIQARLAQQDSHHVSAAFHGASDQHRFGISANSQRVDGHNIARQGNEDDGFSQQNANVYATLTASQHSQWQLQYRHTESRADFDAPNYATTGLPEDADRVTDTARQLAKVDWQWRSAQSQWQHQAGYHYHRTDNLTLAEGQYDTDNDTRRHTLFWQSSLAYQADSRITFAAEAIEEQFQQANASGLANQDRDNARYAAIVDGLHQFNSALAGTFSARYDNNDLFEDAHSVRAGLSYQLAPQSKVYLSLGQAVKNPTFTELYGYFPDFFVGNPDLEAESSTTLEVGAQWQWTDRWRSDVSLFEARLDDEITASADFTSSINAPGESERSGVEASLHGDFDAVSLALNYAYIDARQPDATGTLQPEQRRARHTGGFSVDYHGDERLSVFFSGQYQGTRLDTNFMRFEQVRLAAYTLFSLGGRYQLNKSWSLTMRADNALDHDYEDVLGFRGEQRRAWLGVSYSQ